MPAAPSSQFRKSQLLLHPTLQKLRSKSHSGASYRPALPAFLLKKAASAGFTCVSSYFLCSA
jgi:hypothetical protein